jgi:hypothetical protein
MQTIYNWLVKWFHDHGTKILSFVQGVVAAIAGVSNLIPATWLPAIMGINAILLFLRGFTNTAAITPAPPVVPPAA